METFDLITTIILDKIEHAPLVRIKSRRDMLQKKCCIRVNRKDVQHFFIVDLSNALYDFTGLFCAVGKIIGDVLPIREYCLILALFHCCAHKLECNVLRKTDQAMRIDKAAIELDEIFVALMEKARTYMSNEDEVERLSFAQLAKLLKPSKISSVVIEIFGKLIPNKDDGLQFVSTYDFNQPVAQVVCCHRECANLTLTCDFENLIHQGMKWKVLIGFQFLDDTIHIVAAKKILVATLHIYIETLFVLRIGEIANYRLSERIFTLILYTCCGQRLLDTFLNCQYQIIVTINIGRAIAMNRQNLAAIFDAL